MGGAGAYAYMIFFMYDIEKSRRKHKPEAKVPTAEHSSVSAEGKAGRSSMLENGCSRIA